MELGSFFPNFHSTKKILGLSLPIIGGMLSHNLINLVDTAMIGVLGESALAAVGLGGNIHYVCFAIFIGLSSGVQAVTARRFGQNKFQEAALPLNTGLLLITLIALPLSALIFFLAPLIINSINNDPQVVAQGIPYLKWRILGTLAIGLNLAFRGYWNGIHKSWYYLQILVLTHTCNIFLNWVLIFGNLGAPALGATGAAIASSISLSLGTLVYFIQSIILSSKHGFLRIKPNKKIIKSMFNLSLPISMQQLFFAGGLTIYFWIVGKMGTVDLAITNVLVNLLLVGILPAIGFGLASLSLVGHALGQDNHKEAKQWGWDVVKVGIVIIFLLGIIAFAFSYQILGIFIHSPETMAMAIPPFRLICLTIWIDVIGLVLLNSLNGAGATKTVLSVSIGGQWLFFLPLAFIVGPFLGLGLMAVWLANVSYQCLQSLVFTIIWKRGHWVRIRI